MMEEWSDVGGLDLEGVFKTPDLGTTSAGER
jgi:hypothetical protein